MQIVCAKKDFDYSVQQSASGMPLITPAQMYQRCHEDQEGSQESLNCANKNGGMKNFRLAEPSTKPTLLQGANDQSFQNGQLVQTSPIKLFHAQKRDEQVLTKFKAGSPCSSQQLEFREKFGHNPLSDSSSNSSFLKAERKRRQRLSQ